MCGGLLPSRPRPLPVLSARSWLRGLGVRATAGAAVSPTSGPRPAWGPGARGTPLSSCSTEAVALSRERAWGCSGGGGCEPEGLAEGAPGSILRRRKAEGKTRQAGQAQPARASSVGQRRDRKGKWGRGRLTFCRGGKRPLELGLSQTCPTTEPSVLARTTGQPRSPSGAWVPPDTNTPYKAEGST